MKVVGQELPRVEILEKVTGQSIFGADVHTSPPVLCGKILYSPQAHARIKKIDATKAERHPGVKAVITAKDLPVVRYGNFVADEEYFARDKVRYVGDRVAAVAALDDETAEDALGLIEVEYEPLPILTDALEAMRENAPLIHEEFAKYRVAPGVEGRQGNICTHKRIVQGDTWSRVLARLTGSLSTVFMCPWCTRPTWNPMRSSPGSMLRAKRRFGFPPKRSSRCVQSFRKSCECP